MATDAALASRRNGLSDRSKADDLWRAVDDEGEVLDVLVRHREDTEAAMKLLRRLIHNQPVEPQTIAMDGPV